MCVSAGVACGGEFNEIVVAGRGGPSVWAWLAALLPTGTATCLGSGAPAASRDHGVMPAGAHAPAGTFIF